MGGCLSSSSSSSSFSAAAAIRSSKSGRPRENSAANVISANGDLRQYSVPVTVSQVLLMEFPDNLTYPAGAGAAAAASLSSANNNSKFFFVCNSDRLYYDDYIPALDADDQLQPDQIYFVLPSSKLNYRLTASDMAALAVKASLALQKSTTNSSNSTHEKKASSSSSSSSSVRDRRHRQDGRQNKMARISPVILLDEEEQVNNTTTINYNNSSYNQRVSSSSSSTNSVGGDELIVTVKKKGLSSNSVAPVAVGVSRSGSVRKLQRFSSRRAKMAVRSFRLRLSTIYEEGSVHHFY